MAHVLEGQLPYGSAGVIVVKWAYYFRRQGYLTERGRRGALSKIIENLLAAHELGCLHEVRLFAVHVPSFSI